jgi:sterol desaturase/sphingolipid hydroxylase (fatty acid hydroxylase superfamily)
MGEAGPWTILLALPVRPDQAPAVAGLSQAIQLSVTPVFLLTGISGLLGIFTSRLARIIDRTRVMQENLERSDLAQQKRLRQALDVQKQRTFLINRAILCAGITALLVAGVVAVLFISAVAALDLAAIVVPVFVLAMVSLILGLVLFLLEVQLAIRQNPRRYY